MTLPLEEHGFINASNQFDIPSQAREATEEIEDGEAVKLTVFERWDDGKGWVSAENPVEVEP